MMMASDTGISVGVALKPDRNEDDSKYQDATSEDQRLPG